MNRALLASVLLAGCAIKPDYQRPAIELPAQWKQTAPSAVLQTGPSAVLANAPAANGDWWRVYADPVLDRLVAEAFEHNSDLMAAAARVDESRALVTEAESALYPAVDADVERNRTKSSIETGTLPPGLPRKRTEYRAALRVSYETDFWGRLRAGAQAARAELLATQAARETVRISLAADVVKGYYSLRSLDSQVEATRRSLALREDALVLQRKRLERGVISEFEYRQLEAEVAAARAQLPPLERDREIEEAALAVLLGRSPKAIMEEGVARGAADAFLAPAAAPTAVPAGLPSELLLRRPDLVEAEQRLIALNARVAAARAAYFPSIELTGLLGSGSQALSSLFTGPAAIWSLAVAVAQPIFTAGRLDAQLEAAQARERQALAAYQGSIQNAFREVRSALAAQTRARESYEAEGARVTALAATFRLARLRYINGLASQLDVIDAERGLLAAEIARFEALRSQRAAVADLYRALGG